MLTTLKELLPYAVAVSAIAAAVSAFFAARAARAARRNVQGNFLYQLLTEYGADDMGDAVRGLAQFAGLTAGSGEPPQLDAELDRKRRRFSHYMQKVHTLHKRGLIDETVVRHVAPEGHVLVFLGIEPLEKVLITEQLAKIPIRYDQSSFKFFADLYGLTRRA